jgi:hypothetical protein
VADAPPEDNRDRLNDLFSNQRTSRAKNVVTDLQGNFQQLDGTMPQSGTEAFQRDWLSKNKLDADKGDKGERAGSRVQASGGAKPAGQPGVPTAGPTVANQPQAAGVQGGGKGSLDGEPAEQAQKQLRGGFDEDTRSQVFRYQQRLEEKSEVQQQQQPSYLAPSRRAGGMSGSSRDDADQTFRAFGKDAQMGDAQAGQASASGPPTALASLDVDLPPLTSGYREVLFTTPRGDVEITARGVADTLVGRLLRLAAVLGLAMVAFVAVRLAERHAARLVTSRVTALVLILIGLASLLTGVLSLLGLVVVLAGIGLGAWQFILARRSNQAYA